MELWIFDRSGPYSSSEFNIHKEPEKLIKALTGYANMSEAELPLQIAPMRELDAGHCWTPDHVWLPGI